LNFNNNKITYKEFFGGLKIGLCRIQWLFFEFLALSTLGGRNFVNSIPFLTIFYAPNAPIGGV
jgi:hypothetical protein